MPPEISESEVAAKWDRNAELWADQVRNRGLQKISRSHPAVPLRSRVEAVTHQ